MPPTRPADGPSDPAEQPEGPAVPPDPAATPRQTQDDTAPPDPGPQVPAHADRPRHSRVGRTTRFLLRYGLTTLIGVAGALLGVLLVPSTSVDVGPLTAAVHLRPALHGQTAILLPPAGEVDFDSHLAPVRIEMTVQGVDITEAQHLINDPGAVTALGQQAPEDLIRAAVINALLHLLFAAAGAGLAIGLSLRRLRRALIGAGSAGAVVLASSLATGLTFRPDSLQQPRFEGLLSQAAYVADLGEETAANYEDYRKGLAEFVGQVSALYVAADSLPIAQDRADLITVLHISDVHDNPQAYDVVKQLDDQFDLDAVIDTGDIVSWGTDLESRLLSQIGTLDVPYVFVSGNHDGASAVKAVGKNSNAMVLDNQVAEVEGITIAGIGDPRFAADDDSDAGGFGAGKEAVSHAAYQLGDTITDWDDKHPDDPVDLALIHDPSRPGGLEGRVPLVLSGHMHTSKVELDRDHSGTDWLTVGSTGGALASGGVRPVLEGDDPLDLTARMLYFDRSTQRLVAYDDITMGGLGLVSVSISRHQMPAEQPELKVPDDAETPDGPIPSDQVVEPGEGLPDEDRVTPSAPASPLPDPSDGGRDEKDDAGAG
jgi:predicted MPP superfamily phosphohydrolase